MIYAADGTTLLADLHPPGYQHYYEPLADIGTLLPAAVIAIEDRNFYQEPGVDPQAVVRATVIDWRARTSVEGASTITQQLVKLRLVGNKAETVWHQNGCGANGLLEAPRGLLVACYDANTVVLICSSLTMALAVHAAQMGRRKALVVFYRSAGW